MVDRRLGRGLEFFLSKGANRGGNTPEEPGAPLPGERLEQVEVGQLVANPHQPRREFAPEEIKELAASIRSTGILQPLLVRKVGDRYQIIAGERRWRAAKDAELERVPAIVREITDEQAALFGLVENLHREDLNPLEKARAFQRIQEMTKGSQEDVARQVGLERSTVTNFLRLLDLPGEVQAYVSRGTLTMGHARAILGVAGKDERIHLAESAVRQQLSVRQLEGLVQGLKGAPQSSSKASSAESKTAVSAKGKPAWLQEIEDNLEESLGTPVTVRYSKKRSKIVIECLGRDEFERLYEQLKNLSGE